MAAHETPTARPFDPGFTIEGKTVGHGHPCLVIGEIGVNHNGDPDCARAMIRAAADAGVDCVKFQTFRASEFCTEDDGVYEYVSQGKTVREPMLQMFTRLELERSELAALFDYARELGLVPMSTPADREAVDLLMELGVGAIKIGSDDLVHTPFLGYVATRGLPVILSSGMADEEDIDRALAVFRAVGNPRVALLHCISLYPTPPETINLRRMAALRDRFDLPIGLSDHSFGIEAVTAAVAAGACIVEKHFTLDRGLPGPDHHFSSDPPELAALVVGVRKVERMMGTGGLNMSESERAMRELCRRSIVAGRRLPAGHVVTEADLAYRRPGRGLPPYRTADVVGRTLRHEVAAGRLLMLKDFS